jgi:adenylate cyclase
MMIKSLNQRLVVFLLLPVACLLFLTGFLGFLYARSIMIVEWREAAVLKLQRAAHHLDMRLSRPIQWIHMFHKTAEGQGGAIVQKWILEQLRSSEGVTGVDLQWLRGQPESQAGGMHDRGMGMGMANGMMFHRGGISEVTSPRVDARTGEKTVDLISDLKNEAGETVGKLKVFLGFDYLMQDVLKQGWWQSDQACLVDESGHYLAHTMEMGGRSRLAENGDPLEAAILEDMKVKPSGTVLGEGHPPKMVGGFYRITEAPWTLVMFAPGEKILGPIAKFRIYYSVAGLISILIILLLIRLIGGSMVRAVKELSMAADRIAGGSYGEPLRVRTSDEMGHLIQSFNKMVEGLKERDFISNTFGRYVDHEIAKEILRKPEAGRLGGEKRRVSILMSDIRGFTPIADSLKPEGTIRILNLYFSRMVEHVQKHKGIIVDFFGDGLLVFFDPLDGPLRPALRAAVQCALDMQGAMERLNAEIRAEGLPDLRMGIGVNEGEVVVGIIGSESRAKYGIVGSAVNMTQRIQAAAKGGEVVISDAALTSLLGEIRIGRSFTSQLKGIHGESKLSIVEAMVPPISESRG